MNTFINVKKRHPIANRPLIVRRYQLFVTCCSLLCSVCHALLCCICLSAVKDWDLVMIMEPMTILGALFGSFLNRILPEFVLIFLLAIVLAATANRTLTKGVKLWGLESEENRKIKAGQQGVVASESSKKSASKGGSSSAKESGGRNSGKYVRVSDREDDGDYNDNDDDAGEGEEQVSYSVGDKVQVRDRPDDEWNAGTVTEVDARYPLKPRVKKDGDSAAFVWNYCEPTGSSSKHRSGGGSKKASNSSFEAGLLGGSSGGGATSPRSPTERIAEEEEGGDVVTEMGVTDIIDKYITVGTPATETALLGYAGLPFPTSMAKGEKVLCQRSSGEWCHAKVHSFEDWPPEGGTLTLQVCPPIVTMVDEFCIL